MPNFDDGLTPCMVALRPSDGAVSVLPLLETPIGLALYEGDSYTRVGQIRPEIWTEPGKREGTLIRRSGFAWHLDSPDWGTASGREVSGPKARKALLAAAGYVEAPPNAANPGLFE